MKAMKIKQVILVSGLSGAGKSSVMSILEDNGYLCIDNYPLELLKTLLTWISDNQDSRYSYLALSTSAVDFEGACRLLRRENIKFEAIFLEAADDVLIQRYQFTRNRHPLILSGKALTLTSAILKERAEIPGLPDDILLVDTSHLSTKDLKKMIEAHLNRQKASIGLSLSLVSFGFRYGLPLDADVLFDVRFLNNPYWVEELRLLTGNDKKVADFVFGDKRTKVLLNKITSYLDFSLKESIHELKSHITVAVGCTGGKHRSVTIINYLEDHYKNEYQVLKLHRDIERI